MSVISQNLSAADIEATRKAYDDAIRAWEKVCAEHEELMSKFKMMGFDIEGKEQQIQQLSYVQLSIRILEELGKPTPITVLLDYIRERRNDPRITRGSVETSLLRYLTTKGENASVCKPGPGLYALRQKEDNKAMAASA
jgi:hypothetical protein